MNGKSDIVSVAKIQDILDEPPVIQCCDRHVLVNSKVPVTSDDGVAYIDLLDVNAGFELQQLRTAIKEKNHLLVSLERENHFLKEQLRSLNNLLDQLSVAARSQATMNDIRIKVENSSTLSFKKWYRRPKVVLTGGAIAVMFSIYLRYKIKHW